MGAPPARGPLLRLPSRSPALLALLLVLPLSAWAQQDKEVDASLTPPPLVVAPQEEAPPAPAASSAPRVDRPARWALELLGGGLGGAGVGLLGAAAGCGMVSALEPGNGWACLGGTLLGGLAGIAVGIPLGVSLTGMLVGAEGSPMGAVVGMLVGGAATYGLSAAMGSSSFAFPLVLLTLALPVGGAVLGYELLADSGPSLHASSRRGLRLLPQVALAPDGRSGAVGVGGVF